MGLGLLLLAQGVASRFSPSCSRVMNGRVTIENAKLQARAHMEWLEMEERREKQLWGKRRAGKEPPLTEIHCKKVKIAKRHPEPEKTNAGEEEGELTLYQNGKEEAK